ncbi:MAG: hypothetical protein ACTSRS_03435 [Candidatus Helarchaeota archaeon]
MDQKNVPDLNDLLEGIALKIGAFTDAVKSSTKMLETFSESIDRKIKSLNDNIKTLTDVIKEEDKKLVNDLHELIGEVNGEIREFRDEIKISEIKEVLVSLRKLVKIPEKQVINKNVEKILQEIFEITKELKKQE